MTAPSESKPEQPELSTQDLPIIPTVEAMQAWDREEVLRWIQQRNRNILQDDDLENFNKARIMGMAFLDSDVKFYHETCRLSPGVGLALKHLADEVKEGKLLNRPAGRKRKAPLPSQEDAFIDNDNIISQWKEFYTRARAIRDKGPCGKDLEERAKEEPVDLFNASHTTLNTIDETFEKIAKEEPYNFPKDGDPTLKAACEALSHALQKADRAKAEHDTPEVTQALDNLRKTYDEAAKSNTISMHYIDIEPPYSPYSPIEPAASLKRILLARSWVKELITEIRNESLGRWILIVGRPGGGKSVTLVGYLLFYLIALGARVILESKSDRRLGIIFDNNGVRGISSRDAEDYDDGKPCYRLVSADGPETSPVPDLAFCTATIVVTSPNLDAKRRLKAWQKQAEAYHFIAPPPSCPEVVYLFSKIRLYDSYLVYWMYQEWVRDFRLCRRDCRDANYHIKNGTLVEWYEEKTQSIKSHARSMLAGVIETDVEHQLPDEETNMTIPSDLVTMKRRNKSISKYKLTLMTQRIADIVFDVQEEYDWRFNWRVLNMCFDNPETRVAAGKKFEDMFLQKFQRDLSKMPPCFKMGNTNGKHPSSGLNDKAAVMPWEGLDRQPALEYISIGTDAGGSLYSKKELQAVMVAAMDNDSPPIRFLTPCAQNWETWDVVVFRYTEENGKRAVHVIFLQTTINPEHDIYAKGLNQVRDAIPAEWKYGRGPDVYYHYVLVLLVDKRPPAQIPKWRHVLVSSTERKKDSSWSPDDLRQYVMFVTKKELFRQE